MKSLWNDQDAARHEGELALRVYTSRLLGGDPSLVLHGGGNTSVKLRVPNVFGDEEEILYVKGSGWDLATIEAAGFAPVRLRHLLKLLQLPALSDTAMAAELAAARTDATAPAPSVEAILHALLPFPFVDHTHADALLAVTNTPHGEEYVREVYGETLVVVPYVMPGFELAKACAALYAAQAGPRTIGLVLMNHGLVSFGATARESYERMIALVTRAEEFLAARHAWHLPLTPEVLPAPRPPRREIAALRREVSAVAGAPMILARHTDPWALAFARRDDLPRLALEGSVTPDHVMRTKHLPLLGRDVPAFRAAYEGYFAAHAARAAGPLTMLDPAPRVVLDPDLGLCTIGRTVEDASIAADVYHHTIEIILRATALEEYRALPAEALFDVEYWDLEQAKLRRRGTPPVFAGEVALVTGAASGIGAACVAALRRRGAAVVGLDINPAVVDLLAGTGTLGLCCDVTDGDAVSGALDAAVDAFGGLDMLILNAGIFPSSRRIGDLPLDQWDAVLRVNLDANLVLMREAHPLLKLAPGGGRVAVIGSKNVPAPGPGAAAYSASKAALTQLARVAALEWGGDGIRVNVLHPNAVFDTGIWSDEVLRSRAAQYGMSVEQYRTNNILRVEVTSRDVAELAAELCGPLFSHTTGAQIPIDGGNERVI